MRTIRHGEERSVSYFTDARRTVTIRFVPVFAADSESSYLIAIDVLEKSVDGTIVANHIGF
jgi:hypothetical protein